MANEISHNIQVQASKGGANVSFASRQFFNMTGADMCQLTQEIGTTSTLLSFGSISNAPRVLIVRNLDNTNYVEIGGDSGLTVFKLKIRAGDCCVIEPNSATVYAKANSAACLVQIVAVEQ